MIFDNEGLSIKGYKFVKDDHHKNAKRGGKSCVDLIFTNQTNILIDSGVHPTVYSKCRHKIIQSKKLKLKIEYPTSIRS